MTKLKKWSIILNVNIKATLKSRSLMLYTSNGFKEECNYGGKRSNTNTRRIWQNWERIRIFKNRKKIWKVALGFGDLSENSEYDEAKNAQAENEAKIAELENKVRYAKIIDEKDIDTKTVQIGNTVTLYDIEFDEEVEYTIVGSTEVNLAENKISNESPIGKALLGAKKGATVEVNAPAGIIKYEIRKIKK